MKGQKLGSPEAVAPGSPLDSLLWNHYSMSERKARAVGVLVADAVYFHEPDLLSLLDALDAISELLKR